MHLPEESANESVWSALSWEKRDVRSDALPMMNSFFWPLGECLGVRESFLKLLHLHSAPSLGVGIIHFSLRLNGYRTERTQGL